MKTCPKCSTAHDDEVITCDCGYSFYSSETVSKLMKKNKRDTAKLRIAGSSVLLMAGIAGVVFSPYALGGNIALWGKAMGTYYGIYWIIASCVAIGSGGMGLWRSIQLYLRNL